MKNILIFGDSYGDPYHVMGQSHTIRYIDLLKKEFDVVSYAKAGSDLWSQFKLMQSIDVSDSYVVLFETEPGRITIDNKHYASLNDTEAKIRMLNSNKNYHYSYEYLNAAKNYFIYLQRDDYDIYVQKKIIEDIQKMCNKLIIIPAFNTSTTAKSNNSLYSITAKEHQAWGIKKLYDLFPEYADTRLNHLTTENHKVLATQITKCILDGSDFDFKSFIIPDKNDFNIYFKLQQ